MMVDSVAFSDKPVAGVAYAFDDVLLIPDFSDILPVDADTRSNLTSKIGLSIPIMSSAMDTVTNSDLAIVLAQHGGIGCLHRNCTIQQQVAEVRKVKKHESWIVSNPVTLYPDQTLKDVLELRKKYNYSGMPVVERGSNKLLGILTNRDTRFVDDENVLVASLMSVEGLVTVPEGISRSDALLLLHKHRLEKLIVVDDCYQCVGLITVKDIEKFGMYPNSCKDAKNRLRVAGAVGVGAGEISRAQCLIEADADVIVVDTAHGHTKAVFDTVAALRASFPELQIIAGNVVTAEAAEYLAKAGVDAVKVGVGPGSICTTRVVSGVGYPQFSAICEVSKACSRLGIGLVADGGIRYSGDIAKAMVAGADCVMLGMLFAGTKESPGDVISYNGQAYKSYQGMGSMEAMSRGSSSRYFQGSDSSKFVPEGVEGCVPFRGPAAGVIYQLVGGLKSAMGYTGCPKIADLKSRCRHVVITDSGLKESHPHDLKMLKEYPSCLVSS